MIAAANVDALLILGSAASVAGSGFVEIAADDRETPSNSPSRATNEDLTTAALIESLMQEGEVYRDVDLNHEKIARKLRLPARDGSSAINRSQGMSVSQYVNTYRVKRTCELLMSTADPITKVMFDAGFGTKSNFNREFQRVTGTTPSAYRRARDGAFTASDLQRAPLSHRPHS